MLKQPAQATLIPWITDAIRRMILEEKLQEGQVIHQTNLARELSVSPVPLREALRCLETEGLVTFLPYRGTIVTPVSAAEVKECLMGANALSVVMLPEALPRLSDADLDTLRRLAPVLDAAGCSLDDFTTFYMTALKPAGMPSLLGIIQNFIHRSVRIHATVVANRKNLRDASPTRLEMVEALASRDPERAKTTWVAYHELRSAGLQKAFVGRP